MIPESVRLAFELTGTPETLAGGISHSFRFSGVVVKPVEDQAEATLIAEVMAAVEIDGNRVRVARPIPTAEGKWVADGWTAWRWEAGQVQLIGHQPWSDALTAVDELNRGLAKFDRPQLLGSRVHPWARADRFAWQELTFEFVHEDVAPLVGRYLDGYCPVNLPSQLVHGDTYANLLFADGLAPAVIDFSPYWRPPGWARAVYVIDGLWRTCTRELVQLVIDEPCMDQLLIRAAVFRLVASDLLSVRLERDITPILASHWAFIDLFTDLGVM